MIFNKKEKYETIYILEDEAISPLEQELLNSSFKDLKKYAVKVPEKDQVKNFARDVNRVSALTSFKRVAIPSAIIIGLLWGGYGGYKHLQKEFENERSIHVSNLEESQKETNTLQTILDTVIIPLQQKFDNIMQDRPALAIGGQRILDEYAAGGYDANLIEDLRFFLQVFPDNLDEADYREIIHASGIMLYDSKKAEPFIGNHLTDNDRTVITSEWGERMSITFNPYNIVPIKLWNGKYIFKGLSGQWTKKNYDDGSIVYTKNGFHYGYDLKNDKDLTVYSAHEGTVVRYEDSDLDDIADLYNDPLGRSIIYKFLYEDVEYRVQIGHLDRNGDTPPPLKPGDKIHVGMEIGRMGKTGFANGVHAHITYFKKVNNEWIPFDFYNIKTFDKDENVLYVDWINNYWDNAIELQKEANQALMEDLPGITAKLTPNFMEYNPLKKEEDIIFEYL